MTLLTHGAKEVHYKIWSRYWGGPVVIELWLN